MMTLAHCGMVFDARIHNQIHPPPPSPGAISVHARAPCLLMCMYASLLQV